MQVFLRHIEPMNLKNPRQLEGKKKLYPAEVSFGLLLPKLHSHKTKCFLPSELLKLICSKNHNLATSKYELYLKLSKPNLREVYTLLLLSQPCETGLRNMVSLY